MKVKISITGVKEVDQLLKNLPQAVSHPILQSAHAAAAKPLVNRMKLTAPEGPTGHLVDSIGVVKSSLKRATVIGEIKIGPRKPKGAHAHLVEYGTKERILKGRGKYKAGTSRGKMSKQPFAEPSFDQTKGVIQSSIATEVAKSVVRTMKRYAKRNV